jgi:2-amino-4-hydroxy-6-hydroxymethyldihydropteridine diphosphokinase
MRAVIFSIQETGQRYPQGDIPEGLNLGYGISALGRGPELKFGGGSTNVPEVFIGIGSNLGDRLEYIAKAIDSLRNTAKINIEKTSSIIETDAVGGPAQPKYLNSVIKIKTELSAKKLLGVLQDIEKKLGRIRTVKNGSRTIDLDILLYGNDIVNEPDLKIPHPRMLEREFVMRPLLEIEPAILMRIKR